MGRRTDWENESKPIEEKLVEIVASSELEGMRFAEIVRQAKKADISRATVARYLSKLVEKGLIKKEDLGGRKVYYKLTMEAIVGKHVQRSLFSVLSMHLFNDVLEDASTGRLTDEEFTRIFTGRIGALAMYTLLTGLSMATKDPEEAGKWVEEAFGTLIQKSGWRTCLNRQIFGKPMPLKHPITLKEHPVPEITVEEGVIYVKLPSSIEPGLTMRVLRELPPIPENRLIELKNSLKQLYPEETELLDNAFHQIREAARISKTEVRE